MAVFEIEPPEDVTRLQEILPPEEPLVEQVSLFSGFSDEEFQRRVSIVMEAIKDEEKHRRCLAEIHTYLSMFEQGFREMTEDMAMNGGPMALFKKMMGFGGRGNKDA